MTKHRPRYSENSDKKNLVKLWQIQKLQTLGYPSKILLYIISEHQPNAVSLIYMMIKI